MSKVIDNLIAFRIIYMLVTPFDQTDAFKYGIIDKDGNALKKTKDLKTTDEKESYNQLTKLVFSLKRILGKLPGGKTKLASIVAAYWLIKEAHKNKTSVTQQALVEAIELIENNKITLVEEELDVINYIELMEDGVANVAGAAVATDKPAVRLNKQGKPISGIMGLPKDIVRRKPKLEMGQA
jgi:hypothetical protein